MVSASGKCMIEALLGFRSPTECKPFGEGALASMRANAQRHVGMMRQVHHIGLSVISTPPRANGEVERAHAIRNDIRGCDHSWHLKHASSLGSWSSCGSIQCVWTRPRFFLVVANNAEDARRCPRRVGWNDADKQLGWVFFVELERSPPDDIAATGTCLGIGAIAPIILSGWGASQTSSTIGFQWCIGRCHLGCRLQNEEKSSDNRKPRLRLFYGSPRKSVGAGFTLSEVTAR